ncbi:hypothetical protein PHJA_000304100 [Phtheirospermum japonicum]|uniref:Protein KAKU4 n=1 Tax=Phtheirospermum japonicum TaxID=374723 RepID=A0A830B962_9LAMI|nr:hypothetical protein PHJA_000304100 [Phtheirospermum japonicum]
MATSRSGAGGKIVSNRRKQRLSATPYDRPPPPPLSSPPPPPKSPNLFRFLASGAGKFLNYLFAESESSSSEDEDSASADDIDDENLYEMPFNEVDTLNEENVQNSETKWTIEQLIMQANFSREESDKLKKVLDSRVLEAGEKNLLAGSPGKTFDNEDADIYNKAVQEAKRWFQEKKAGSSSVAELAHGTSNLNSTGLGHMEAEGGSPVDVARSYMKERPPWSSPTRSFELRTPLTTTMKLFKERTLDSVSSKNRSTLVSGSWNIQEELRRVRTKATEDMLRSPPAKTDPSLFQVGSNRVESFRAAFQPVTSVSRNNEDSEAVAVEDEIDNAKLLRPSSSNHAEEHHTGPSLSDINGVPATKVTEIDEKQNVNGFSSSQTSLSAGQHDEENLNIDKANDKKPANNVEGNCGLLSEAYMEVPVVTEDSQISMGMQYEELAVDMAQPSSDEKAEIVAGKQQQTRKSGRNSRRGRGRGK